MLLRANPQWADVLEASYAPANDHSTWAERVCDASRAVFGASTVIGMTAFDHSATCATVDVTLVSGMAPTMAKLQSEMLVRAGRRAVRQVFYPPAVVATHLELEPSIDPDVLALMRGSRRALSLADCVGLVAHPQPGTAGVLFVGDRRVIALRRHERELMTRMALHIEAGLRIRLRPESVVAVLATDGRLLHHEEGAPESETLRTKVRSIERARTRRFRGDASVFDLWPALTSGHVSIVERVDGGRRCYLVVENAPATRRLHALTRKEIDVVALASRGLSSKLIAYALGVSTPRISAMLSSATNKIGLATRLDLVRVAAMITRDPSSGLEDTALTVAERDVLELVSQGLSNAEIAQMRNRSVRTIANQVAQLLRKTGSPTRRALIARFPA